QFPSLMGGYGAHDAVAEAPRSPLSLKRHSMLTWTEKGERLDGEMHNRLGFAVQLAVLRFPGRPLKDLAGVPSRVLAAIADQVQVPASAFARYGERDNTLYEHLDEIRRGCGLRECGWREYLWLARQLLPLA